MPLTPMTLDRDACYRHHPDARPPVRRQSPQGIPVEDIMTASCRQPHKLTPFVRVNGTQIAHPAEALPLWEASKEP